MAGFRPTNRWPFLFFRRKRKPRKKNRKSTRLAAPHKAAVFCWPCRGEGKPHASAAHPARFLLKDISVERGKGRAQHRTGPVASAVLQIDDGAVDAVA